MATSTGLGATLTAPGVTLAEILDISWSGISRPVIETTNMATVATLGSSNGGRTFIPGSPPDAGEITAECNLDANTSSWIDALDNTGGAVVLTFPDTTTWTSSGFVTALSVGVPLEDKMTISVTIKLTGQIV